MLLVLRQTHLAKINDIFLVDSLEELKQVCARDHRLGNGTVATHCLLELLEIDLT